MLLLTDDVLGPELLVASRILQPYQAPSLFLLVSSLDSLYLTKYVWLSPEAIPLGSLAFFLVLF